MLKDKVGAYAQQQKRSLTPREVEAMAFTKAALMLEDAKKKIDSIEEYSKALTEPDNNLPDEIKANVMSLSIFVDKHTTKALRSSNPGDLDVLININRNLAAGLRTTPQTGAAPSSTPAPTSGSASA